MAPPGAADASALATFGSMVAPGAAAAAADAIMAASGLSPDSCFSVATVASCYFASADALSLRAFTL